MIISCPECTNGTLIAWIYMRVGGVSLRFSDQSCECRIDQLRLASSALRQQAALLEQAATPASGSTYPLDSSAKGGCQEQALILSTGEGKGSPVHDRWNPLTSTYEEAT